MATVAPPLRIGPADHGRMMTLEEFREAEELDGYRYELARGVLEVADVPAIPALRFFLGKDACFDLAFRKSLAQNASLDLPS